jgi:hypothetical protein
LDMSFLFYIECRKVYFCGFYDILPLNITSVAVCDNRNSSQEDPLAALPSREVFRLLKRNKTY